MRKISGKLMFQHSGKKYLLVFLIDQLRREKTPLADTSCEGLGIVLFMILLLF